MWPVLFKAGIKIIRSYSKKRSLADLQEEEFNNEQPDLPALPLIRPAEIWTTASTVRALGDRDLTTFLDPLIKLFKLIIKTVNI